MCDCINGWVGVINFQEERSYSVPCEKCEKGQQAIERLIEFDGNYDGEACWTN